MFWDDEALNTACTPEFWRVLTSSPAFPARHLGHLGEGLAEVLGRLETARESRSGYEREKFRHRVDRRPRGLAAPTTSALAATLGPAPSTVSEHITSLVAAGLVQRLRAGVRALYEPDGYMDNHGNMLADHR
ncbi:winged helix-turn-helix domain-containing protein [Streptomyces radiopugnans]|uniref:winged helix-turn-helix domain-containing protein n=1 Tax=Streptomyces radiopugnans TaxID=403935 RepID=UPI003F1A67C6